MTLFHRFGRSLGRMLPRKVVPISRDVALPIEFRHFEDIPPANNSWLLPKTGELLSANTHAVACHAEGNLLLFLKLKCILDVLINCLFLPDNPVFFHFFDLQAPIIALQDGRLTG